MQYCVIFFWRVFLMQQHTHFGMFCCGHSKVCPSCHPCHLFCAPHRMSLTTKLIGSPWEERNSSYRTSNDVRQQQTAEQMAKKRILVDDDKLKIQSRKQERYCGPRKASTFPTCVPKRRNREGAMAWNLWRQSVAGRQTTQRKKCDKKCSKRQPHFFKKSSKVFLSFEELSFCNVHHVFQQRFLLLCRLCCLSQWRRYENCCFCGVFFFRYLWNSW